MMWDMNTLQPKSNRQQTPNSKLYGPIRLSEYLKYPKRQKRSRPNNLQEIKFCYFAHWSISRFQKRKCNSNHGPVSKPFLQIVHTQSLWEEWFLDWLSTIFRGQVLIFKGLQACEDQWWYRRFLLNQQEFFCHQYFLVTMRYISCFCSWYFYESTLKRVWAQVLQWERLLLLGQRNTFHKRQKGQDLKIQELWVYWAF